MIFLLFKVEGYTAWDFLSNRTSDESRFSVEVETAITFAHLLH